MLRVRKMCGEEIARDLDRESVIRAECFVDVLDQAAVDFGAKQCCLVGIAAAGDGNAVGTVDLPHSVALQAPEGKFRMHGLAWRTEFAQQLAEPSVDQPVRRHAALAAQATADRPQYEEALVGRALPVALPDLEAAEEISKVSGSHESYPR